MMMMLITRGGRGLEDKIEYRKLREAKARTLVWSCSMNLIVASEVGTKTTSQPIHDTFPLCRPLLSIYLFIAIQTLFLNVLRAFGKHSHPTTAPCRLSRYFIADGLIRKTRCERPGQEFSVIYTPKQKARKQSGITQIPTGARCRR